MHTSFMIGSDLLFDSRNMICHSINDGKEINLSGVKGRCLKCLMANTQQEVTTKKQIFDEVWGQFGLSASDNTLLQTIYALRRDLKDMGMTDLIITHPRLGYQINPLYIITPIAEPEYESTPSPQEAHHAYSEPEPDVLQVNLHSSHSGLYSKMKGTQTGITICLTLHRLGIIVVSFILLILLMSLLLVCFLSKNDEFIISTKKIPSSPFINTIQSEEYFLLSCEHEKSYNMVTKEFQNYHCSKIN